MSTRDLRVWKQLRSAYEKKNDRRLNSILFVKDGTLDFDVRVPAIVQTGKPFNITVLLCNNDDRPIVICRPYIKQVTLQPAVLNEVFFYTYGVMCGVDGVDWCQTLWPGQRVAVTVEPPLFVENEGRHRLRISLLLPKYGDLASSCWKTSFEHRGMVEIELEATKGGCTRSASFF